MPRSAKFSFPRATLCRHLVSLWSFLIPFSSPRILSISSSFGFIGCLFLLACTDASIPFSRSRKFFLRSREEKLIGNSGGTVGSVSRIPRRIYLVSRSARHSLFFVLSLAFSVGYEYRYVVLTLISLKALLWYSRVVKETNSKIWGMCNFHSRELDRIDMIQNENKIVENDVLVDILRENL